MSKRLWGSVLLSSALVLGGCGGAVSSSASSQANTQADTPVSAEVQATPDSAQSPDTAASPTGTAAPQRTTSQVLSPEEPTSHERGGSGRWSYVKINYPSEISYQFEDVQVTVPSSWDGLYELVEESDNSAVFYHKASHEKWQEQGNDKGGWLFSVNFSTNTDYLDLPSFCELGSTSEGYYYLEFPTDMQGYRDADISSEYLSMSKDQMYIRNNSWVTVFS